MVSGRKGASPAREILVGEIHDWKWSGCGAQRLRGRVRRGAEVSDNGVCRDSDCYPDTLE